MKITCNNPYCKVHGYKNQQERVKDGKVSLNDGREDQYKSRVSNAYGVTDDLNMDSDEDVPVSTKKSKAPSDHRAGSVSPTSKVVVKPRRQLSHQNR